MHKNEADPVTHRVSVAADFVLVVFPRAAGTVGARVCAGCDVDRLQVGLAIPALLYVPQLTLSGLTNHRVDCGIHFFTKVYIGFSISLPSLIVSDDEAADKTDNLKICERVHVERSPYSSDSYDELINTSTHVTSLPQQTANFILMPGGGTVSVI